MVGTNWFLSKGIYSFFMALLSAAMNCAYEIRQMMRWRTSSQSSFLVKLEQESANPHARSIGLRRAWNFRNRPGINCSFQPVPMRGGADTVQSKGSKSPIPRVAERFSLRTFSKKRPRRRRLSRTGGTLQDPAWYRGNALADVKGAPGCGKNYCCLLDAGLINPDGSPVDASPATGLPSINTKP